MAEYRVGGEVKAALILAATLTALGIAIGGLAIGIITVLLVVPILAFVTTRVPLRYSMMTLMLCAFVLEAPDDQPMMNMWHTPLYPVGMVIFSHWNTIDRGALAMFSNCGLDVCLLWLLLVGYQRRASGSKIDRTDHVPTPKPLVQLGLVSFAGIVFMWLNGMVRGGDFGKSLWQIYRVIYLPLLFILFHWGLRGPKDHRALLKVLLVGGLYKSILATIVIHTVFLQDPAGYRVPLAYATTHHDTMLFANTFVVLFALLIEKTSRRAKYWAALGIPIVLLGIASNGRRLAYVQVVLAILAIYVVTPDSPIKRRLRRIAMVVAPVALMYVAVGWNSGSSLFKPVRAIHSVVDAKTDASTMWRELENFDLVQTLRQNPLLGSGYGHKFFEVVTLPMVDYDLEFYAPHNSILGLWAFGGYVGFLALTVLWIGGVFFAMRGYQYARDASERIAAMCALCAVPIYLAQCWGDLGLGTWVGIFTVAPAIAAAGKLAAANGGWIAEPAKKVAAPRAQPARENPGWQGQRASR
jgi:hypothetical protein